MKLNHKLSRYKDFSLLLYIRLVRIWISATREILFLYTFLRPGVSAVNLALLWNFLSLGEKLQRGRVQAVAPAGRRRAIRENVALVAAAACTADLYPAHTVAVILDVF